MHLINPTDLVVSRLLVTDQLGADTLLFVAKGTWRIDNTCLSVADEQVPVYLEPVYLGEKGTSSLIHESDLFLKKPATDCILLGRAWAPRGRVASLDVSFAVGSLRKTLRVFGERIWMKWLWTVSMSRPVPFESIPLLWERAFGGADTSFPDASAHEFCLANPVGRGMLARRSKTRIDGMRLPNIENPASLISSPEARPAPAGFAPIPGHWQPRAKHAGTYDEKWLKQRSPLPPEDLSPAFYCSAAPGLATARHLVGNESVMVENASKQGRLSFQLPCVRPRVRVKAGPAEEELDMALDTLVVEPDRERLVLTWRGKLNVHGRVHQVERIRVDLTKI